MGVFLSHSPRYSLEQHLSLNLELGWSHLSWLGYLCPAPYSGITNGSHLVRLFTQPL